MDLNVSGIEFENICQTLVEKMGFTSQTTKASGDGGIDLIAFNHQPLLSGKYIIQCKRYSGSVGAPIIRDLYGVITSERANKGILMTTGCFTKSAIEFADGKPIELIDGEMLKKLLLQYGLLNDEGEDFGISIEKAFGKYYMIDEYNDFLSKKVMLYNNDDEEKRAEFINEMLSWTMSLGNVVSDLAHKLPFFKEIKEQISLYLQYNRNEKNKYLAYIYQMIYVQLSILQGEFREAVSMFSKLMENKELQFTIDETIEPKYTAALWKEHIGIFWSMYCTFYDMVQVSVIVDDSKLQEQLLFDEKYYGYPFLARGVMYKSSTQQQKSADYIKFWEGELKASENIENITCLYFLSDYEAKMYFNYTYRGESVNTNILDRYNILVENNTLNVENFGTIQNLQGMIKKYWEK